MYMDLSNIAIDDLAEEYMDIDELYNYYKKQINQLNILETGTFLTEKINLNGEFDEDYWVIYMGLSQQYRYIRFATLKKIENIELSENEILLIKCWVADNLINKINEVEDRDSELYVGRITTAFNRLIYFIKKSNNFSKAFIDDKKGSYFDDFFMNKNELYTYTTLSVIVDYLNFISDYNIIDDNILNLYLNKIALKMPKLKQSKSRELPSSQDILLFDNYINIFFNDKNVNVLIKEYYRPILLWWKITNIIPMRPSEFCLKIRRNCLIKDEENNDYYLRIDRIKKKANLKANLLPVLTTLKITKDIYKLINDYIIDTEELGEADTLISYNAIEYYREKLINELNFWRTDSYNNLPISKKIDKSKMSNTVFGVLLLSFYEKVIVGIYKDNRIKMKVRPNDTRHFAFTSLVLQGYSPIEVAIIGGHRDLRSIDSYVSNIDIYIDTQVMVTIRKNFGKVSLDKNYIVRHVFNMPEKCPTSMEKCIPDEYNIGYCTADLKGSFKKGINPCEHQGECCYCSKWWCLPTVENKNKLFVLLQQKLDRSHNRLEKNIDFFKKILRQSGLIVVNNDLQVDRNLAIESRRLSLDIGADAQNLMNLKLNSLNCISDDFDIYDKLNIINNFENIDKRLVK